MTESTFHIRQLADALQPPKSGKQNAVVLDDTNVKVILFAFATGNGLTEHVAPFPAIIQMTDWNVLSERSSTVADEVVREAREKLKSSDSVATAGSNRR